MGNQGDLNFPRLDSEASQLDLIIQPAEESQGAVGIPGSQISTLVEPGCRIGGEGIGDEFLRRQPRVIEITAGQAGAADVEFTGDADRAWLAGGAEHLQRGQGNRPADCHPSRINRVACSQPMAAGERGIFRRPIAVDQRMTGRERIQQALHMLRGKHIPPREHLPHPSQGF